MKSFTIIATILLGSALAAVPARRFMPMADDELLLRRGDDNIVKLPDGYELLLNPPAKVTAAIASKTALLNGVQQSDYVDHGDQASGTQASGTAKAAKPTAAS
ncbi:hypothetical protein EDB81DRAFT_758507 [Dactylonectria macrodidyma]|uniref:Uncharacterized protein n=1 Tax=Dactylonectria macrodidyma TaxID=307937 RepID=A0A9P9F781_9HYPO|nr:hypothetical protein EDB81DRAFT_758507 [Dactylonectria macrodidyma]